MCLNSIQTKIEAIIQIKRKMSEHPLKKQASLIMLGLMLAGVNAGGNLRAPYSDPYCNTFNSDGSCCLKCSYHYYMDAKGACQPVSDWCKTWNEKTGACTSCFQGYGNPVKGVCGSAPPVDNGNVGGQDDDHCADYGYLDAKKTWRSVWSAGCTKVCIECDDGYFLTPSYKCVLLPQNCASVNDDGECTACDDGFDLNQKGQCCKNVVGDGNDDESSKDDHKDDHKKGHRRRRWHHKHDKQSESKHSDKDSDSKKQDCESDEHHFGKFGKGKLHKFRKNHDNNESESYEWDSKLLQWKEKFHGKFDKDSKGHDKDSKSCEEESKSHESKSHESESHQSKSHQLESHQSKSRETDCESISHKDDDDSKKFGHASRAEFQFTQDDAEEPVEPQEPQETEDAEAV